MDAPEEYTEPIHIHLIQDSFLAKCYKYNGILTSHSLLQYSVKRKIILKTILNN